MHLILDNLRSAHNVGALFRTADGAGVEHIYLVGITPQPPKPGRLALTLAEKALQKTALGAELAVSWTSVKTLAPLLRRLKKEGYEIVALEEGVGVKSVDYRDWQPQSKKRPALIVGNEVTGLSIQTLARADTVIRLPMRGRKHSLNVAVAGGIAVYHLSATIDGRGARD